MGVILRFGVHVAPSMSDMILSCAVNASPATVLVNVSGRFYEYTLKGEVSRAKGHQVQDDEMLRKVRKNSRTQLETKALWERLLHVLLPSLSACR